MPEAFITGKTKDVVSIQLGGEVDGIFFDGEVEMLLHNLNQKSYFHNIFGCSIKHI